MRLRLFEIGEKVNKLSGRAASADKNRHQSEHLLEAVRSYVSKSYGIWAILSRTPAMPPIRCRTQARKLHKRATELIARLNSQSTEQQLTVSLTDLRAAK